MRDKLEVGFTGLCAVLCAGAWVCKDNPSSLGYVWAAKATNIQYKNVDGTFSSGSDDMYSCLLCSALLCVARKIAIGCFFSPIATLMGIRKAGDFTKFTQQGWVLVYYVTAFCWGLKEIISSSYWLNLSALWHGYPHTAAMTLTFKCYFICQAAFWIHMVFVTLIEPWQKDFPVMLAHHFITIGMLLGAYHYGVLTVTHAILVEQDLADCFLPAAKMCNYIAAGESRFAGAFQVVADILFAVFAAVWIPTRHVILPTIYYSILTDAEDGLLQGGCDCGFGNQLVYAPEKGCTLSPESWPNVLFAYKIFLAAFQLLLAIWLKDILKAVCKALMGEDLQSIEAESDQAAEFQTKKSK